MIKKITITSFVFLFIVSCSVTQNDAKKTYKAEDLSDEQIANYNLQIAKCKIQTGEIQNAIYAA